MRDDNFSLGDTSKVDTLMRIRVKLNFKMEKGNRSQQIMVDDYAFNINAVFVILI